jgi:hypothetical protein
MSDLASCTTCFDSVPVSRVPASALPVNASSYVQERSGTLPACGIAIAIAISDFIVIVVSREI